jgi:SAM-dependent methyltransferase
MENLSFYCPSCLVGELEKIGPNNLDCGNCSKNYPVIDGIPRIVKLDNYSESFGFQWNIHQKSQLDSYTGLPISRDRVYAATNWSDKTNLSGQSILEAGSGSGRFTEVLVKTSGNIYSFDFSSAVDANMRNCGDAKNLNLFQGDIFNIPFKNESFDHVFCLGVLQHTPDPELAFHSLVSKVKQGGYIYIDVYTQSWYHYIHWKYILRPITIRMNREKLYQLICYISPKLIPISRLMRKYFGRFGARLVPIVEYSHLGLSKEINQQWSILDTFDMYSPAHDHPQSKLNVQKWFKLAKLKDVRVWYGDNGIVARGIK